MIGFRIIEDPCMTDTVEDWSRVRSPSRAMRRRRWHMQNIVYRQVPKKEFYRMGDTLIMHPEMARELRRRVSDPDMTEPRDG